MGSTSTLKKNKIGSIPLKFPGLKKKETTNTVETVSKVKNVRLKHVPLLQLNGQTTPPPKNFPFSPFSGYLCPFFSAFGLLLSRFFFFFRNTRLLHKDAGLLSMRDGTQG